MRLFKISERHFLLLHLSILSFTYTRSVKVTEVTQEKTVEVISSRNQSSAHEGTTAVPLKLNTGSNRKLISPTVAESLLPNNSKVFRPSVHLGEIEQSRIKTNPFNNVQHVKFENNVQIDTQHDRFQDILHDAYQGVFNILDEATRPSRIKFQDDSVVETPGMHHFNNQQTVTLGSTSQFEEATIKPFVEQTFFQEGIEKPEVQETLTMYEKPVTEHGLTNTYFDVPKSPYVISYYTDNNQNAYQPTMQEAAFGTMQKPDGVLVLQQQEATYTRKRKFPYQYYQPTGGYHDVEFAEKPRHSISTYPQSKRLTPWKKFIHLIGTFLPLGLLLATLTPNIVRIDNTTQPNIVLSKLRVIDLPVEHKQTRMLGDQLATCEDRSICELILAGGEPQSNILQNILWNLAIRMSDDVARKNGLREIFNAVKKKDCMRINC